MQITDEQTRQTFGCGWAPIPPERLRSRVRLPQPLKFEPLRDADGVPLVEVCPTYLVQLPAVSEVVHARHWKHDLRMWCDGKPHPHLLTAIEILDGAINETEHARMTKREDGGLAD